jgi:electron transfer flavoprotein beta subunit
MRIVVLVKAVPDTWETRVLDAHTGRIDRSGTPLIDEVGERAVEAALAHRDQGADVEIVALAMGPESAREALIKALALGADSAIHVIDEALAGADMLRTSAVLAAAIQRTGFDLVLAGNESTDGRGGMLPAMVAEHLRVAHATHLNSLELDGASVRGQRQVDAGTVAVEADLPAVVSLTEQAPEARFPNFRGIMKAKKKPYERLTVADLGLEEPTAASEVRAVRTRPERVGGTTLVDDGTAGERIAQFLADNHQI